MSRRPNVDLSSIEGPPVDFVDQGFHASSTVDVQDISSIERPPTLHRASTDPRRLNDYPLSGPEGSSEQHGLLQQAVSQQQHKPLEPHESLKQNVPRRPDEYYSQTFFMTAFGIASEATLQIPTAYSADSRMDNSDVSSVVPPPVIRQKRAAPREIFDFSSLDGPSHLKPSVSIESGPPAHMISRLSPNMQSDSYWCNSSKELPPRPESTHFSLRNPRRMSNTHAELPLRNNTLGSSPPSYGFTVQIASPGALSHDDVAEKKPSSADELLLEEYLLDGLARPPSYSSQTSLDDLFLST